MKGPLGFKYLALALLFSIALGVSYLIFFYFGTNIPKCIPDFSSIKFAKVISNKDGRVHKLVPNPTGPFNHAYRKLVTQSRTYGGGGVHGGFRAVDGYVEGTYAHTEEFQSPYMDLDLSTDVNVKCVRVWNRNDEFANRLVPYSIFLSRVPFRADMSYADSKKVAQISQEYTDVQQLYTWNLTNAIPARFVRIQLRDKNFLNVYELEVFDTHVPETFRFVPRYIQQTAELPLIPLPTTFNTFLPIAGQVVNLTSPLRVFDHTGIEVTPTNYVNTLMGSSIDRPPELHISEGENFVGDVKICLVFLCTAGVGYNTNADYLSEVFSNLEIMSANYFKLFQYTVIIFYSWGDQAETNKQSFTKSFPWLDIRFVDVSRHFPPGLPQHLIDNKVDMSLYEQGSDCAPGNHWKLNYLHMGRFWSTKLWFEPILKEFDLIWRLDADATVDEPIHPGSFNFLREMWSKKKQFAYWCRFGDTAECDDGVLEAAETFAKKKGLEFKHKNKISENTGYWGGFGVYGTKFFCHNKDWLEYVDYLDSLGGHYNHRWGEQNVFPWSLSLFLEFDELYWVRNHNIKIFHDHEPMSTCAGVSDWDLKHVTKKK